MAVERLLADVRSRLLAVPSRLLAVLSRLLADQNPMTVVEVTCQMQQNRQNHRLTFAVCRRDLD